MYVFAYIFLDLILSGTRAFRISMTPPAEEGIIRLNLRLDSTALDALVFPIKIPLTLSAPFSEPQLSVVDAREPLKRAAKKMCGKVIEIDESDPNRVLFDGDEVVGHIIDDDKLVTIYSNDYDAKLDAITSKVNLLVIDNIQLKARADAADKSIHALKAESRRRLLFIIGQDLNTIYQFESEDDNDKSIISDVRETRNALSHFIKIRNSTIDLKTYDNTDTKFDTRSILLWKIHLALQCFSSIDMDSLKSDEKMYIEAQLKRRKQLSTIMLPKISPEQFSKINEDIINLGLNEFLGMQLAPESAIYKNLKGGLRARGKRHLR